MNAICGILGRRDPGAVRAMAKAMAHRGDASHVAEGDAFSVASSSPLTDPPCLVDGTPRDLAGNALDADGLRALCDKARDPARLQVQGAFAAALCAGGDRWWLMRDRLGVKPLYYFEGPDFLLFASELKALLASGRVDKCLNLASVDRYLTLRCVPGPESIIQDVYRVNPGHVIEYRRGKATDAAFASFDLEVRRMPRDVAANRLLALLEKALDKGTANALLWSAGIDCAALAALTDGPCAVFVELKSAWQDESWRAKESARLLGVPMQKLKARILTEAAFAKMAYHLDEPLADASVLPLWLIAERAAGHAPVLCTGHGADELLGGYPRYHFLQKAHGAKRLVPVNFLSGIMPSLPPNAFVRRGSHYLTSIRDNLDAYLSLLAVFDQAERDELYTDAMRAAIHEKGGSVSVMRPHFVDGDLTCNLLSLDLSVGLPDLLLAKCDRIMAAHGASLEFPYLDDDLVDFSISLSPDVKYRVRSKPLLRQAMKGVLPGRVRMRARRGFRMPESGPTLRVIENVTQDTITQERVEASGLFKWRHVEQVVRSANHNVYRRRQFWAILMFFAWYREVMES